MLAAFKVVKGYLRAFATFLVQFFEFFVGEIFDRSKFTRRSI